MTTRWNPITGEPALFAPGRAGRPHAFIESEGVGSSRCPFCPGHEADTPPAIRAVGDPWRIRVFPNKYPPAAGAEVIVESRDHDAVFDRVAHAAEVVAVWRERWLAHSTAPATALFRNEGERAGASIPHLHSQLVPLPFVPPRVARETAGFLRAAACPLCAGPAGEAIDETDAFVRIAPHASGMPYQQWILPRRHLSNIGELGTREIEDLATLLRSSARTTAGVAAGFNWSFMNFTEPRAHFYVDVLPRTTMIAGLELGTGTFVEIVDPAAAARRLRG